MEHRVGEIGAGALQLGGQGVACLRLEVGISEAAAEDAPDALHDRRCRGLVQRDAHRGVVKPQVDLLMRCARDDLLALAVDGDRHSVEIALELRREAELFQPGRQHCGAPVHRACDMREAFGTMINGVHRGDHRQQHLRGADVGGGLLATDVLLAGLQRQAIGGFAAGVDRQPDNAAGQRALQRLAYRHVGGMRAAIAHWHAESLRRADRDVGAEIAGRGQQR